MKHVNITNSHIEILLNGENTVGNFYIHRSKVKEDWIERLRYKSWWNKAIEKDLTEALDVCRKNKMLNANLEKELRFYMEDKNITSSIVGIRDMMEKGFAYASIYRAAKKLGMKGPHGTWIKPTV